MKDYYKILGISIKATSGEIRKAYRKLAFQYHPDVNAELESNDQFNEITEAYEVLIDPDLRKKYDIGFLYQGSFIVNQQQEKTRRDNYRKYGNSAKNPSAHTPKNSATKMKQIRFPRFEKFMYRTLLSFGILGLMYSIRDLFIKDWDGVNSLTGFFFSIIFTTLLVNFWRIHNSSDE